MKKRTRKSISFLLVLVLLSGCNMYVAPTADAAEAVNGTVKEYSVREKTLPMYLGAVDSKEDLSVYYINESGVPYIPVEFIPHILNKWLEVDQYEISAGENENIVTVLRKNTLFTAEFDFGEDTVTFIDYDAFMKPEGEPLVSLNVMSSEIGYLFKPIEELTNDRYGKEICFDLKPYEIDLVMHDGDHYVPLHTISDLMLSYYNTYSLYNGESVIITAGLDKELADIYYSCAPERTEEFALFDYHELCFALDHLYGLKEIHGIDSFDDYFYEIGMRKRLKSTDQSEADAAMYEFITCFLDDLHSSFNDLSCGTDPDVYFKKVENIVGPWKTKFDGWIEEFDAERSRFYPDGYLPYEEVGNTAFITFDNFSHISEDIDYLSEPSEEELNDTIRLMQYSYDRIMRKDSPVENVVMDLSVNTGGSIHAACYVLGMYLGRGSINIKNTMTGATTTSQYHIDANRDGNYDDKDTFANSGLNLYCMISPVSFSCGNLVPNEFKADPHITLIGKTSGGGSCSIMPMATAGGNIFTISGYRRMSTFKNGSFYDIDRGADPDIYIAKIADFYDREYIADLINGNE